MTNGVSFRSLGICGFIFLISLLSGCGTTTAAHSDGSNKQAVAAQTAAAANTQAAIEHDVFPSDVILTCPEPETPEPVVQACPPAKAVKCPVCPTPAVGRIDGKILVGQVEKVTIVSPRVTYTARIDTGATGSSIHATDIVRFERDGERWVRFNISDAKGKAIPMERKVIRRVRVRQAELEDFERRLVVMISVKLGSITEQLEMSLTDRSSMEFPILIGRNLLRNNAIVDVSQEFIAK